MQVDSEPASRAVDPDPLVGREVAAFRLGALIGRGGMGRVYTAEHALLGRRVAIKVLEPQFVADEVAVQRFVEEARAVNGIRHPNIIDITDFGDLDGRPYFVMELLDGETLGARLESWGHLEADVAVRICVQVASALTAAHAKGVIHRDLKPDNIFLCNHPDYPDHVKVLDFGIAKLTQRSVADHGKASTQAGMLLGTPLYMSPEQSLGEAIDPRSDVYALGVVLFEAVTGVSPFDRPSLTEILLAHVHESPPSPRTIDPTISEALEAVILRALAKRPSGRFDDMRQMRAALVACQCDAPPAPRSLAAAPAAAVGLVVPAQSGPVTVALRPTTAAIAAVAAPATAARVAPVARVASAPAAASARVAAVSMASARVAAAPAPVAPVPAAVPGLPAAAPSPGAVIAGTLRGIILKRIATNRLVLPSLPSAMKGVLQALNDPDANLAQVAEALERDLLIAPQLLRVATSVAYRASTVPTTVQQAVARIGVARLRTLLFELSIRRVFASPRPSFAAAFRGMWKHSFVVATLARRTCEQLGNPVDAEAVHLGGLLHDVGKPLIGVMLFEAEKQLGARFRVDLDTWIDIVDRSHRDVAIALASKWELSAELQHAIAGSDEYHSDPSKLTTNIVCFANAVAEHAGQSVGPVDASRAELLVAEGADRLGLEWRFVHDLRTIIQELADDDGAGA